MIGPLLGTFHDPRGWTSLKNRSTNIEKVHSIRSYIQLTMGASSLRLAISFESWSLMILDLPISGTAGVDYLGSIPNHLRFEKKSKPQRAISSHIKYGRDGEWGKLQRQMIFCNKNIQITIDCKFLIAIAIIAPPVAGRVPS